MSQEVMLDIETLSSRPNAVITVIGAIKFSRTGKLQPLEKLETFYRRINIQSCLHVGLQIDKNTLEWWNKQDKDAKYECIDNTDRVTLTEALNDFKTWFGNCEKIWGNGDDFDCTILDEAYTRTGIEKPWKFWNTRDVRTLFDLGCIRKYDLPNNNEHHALHDCYRQIVGVKKALKNLDL